MDQFSLLIDAFDKLDIVLAVFGAVIVSMWFGRGKTLRGLISGALVGGLVKPLILLFILGGAFAVAEQGHELKQTPEQQDKILKFWTK